jgi:hypothetical protein
VEAGERSVDVGAAAMTEDVRTALVNRSNISILRIMLVIKSIFFLDEKISIGHNSNRRVENSK